MMIQKRKRGWIRKGTALLAAACLLLSAAAPTSVWGREVWYPEGDGEIWYPDGDRDRDRDVKEEAVIPPSKTQVFTPKGSKKGLQFGESVEDALDLGTKYCLFNVNITEFMETSGNQLAYKYKGGTYTFSQDAFEHWGSLFVQLQDAGVHLFVEFLLPWVDGLTDFIHPAARTPGHNYYAWNISTPDVRGKYEALFSCIAEEFDGRHGLGYIGNYLIGNEVNAYDQWHYTGSTSLKENAGLYADTFQLVDTAVKDKSPEAKVSICLEHSWNTDIPGRVHSSRSFLDTFVDGLEKYGDPDFTISYHAYSEPLTKADFWNSSQQQVKDSVDSPCITMKNIKQLTKYVKSKYGRKTRIMLTEQGYSSHGPDGEIKQAAAIAYSYYIAEANDMIDCIIFRCQADSPGEIANDGLYMGLWTAGMGQKKASYDVYKYMDTPKYNQYTQSCREYLGVDDWTQLVPGFDAAKTYE